MTRRISYNHCGLCGYTPHTDRDEPNWAPVRWWSPDDGWCITTLCRWCIDEVGDAKPDPQDYAYHKRGDFAPLENEHTDEDPSAVLD